MMPTHTYYSLRYLQEFLEAFIAYSIYMFIKTKNINIYNNVQVALVIGFITLLLEEYNPAYNKAVKTGMLTSVVTHALTN